MKSVAIVLASLLTGANVVGPADLLEPNVPDGFELAVEQPTDLTFEDYAPLSPDATAHIDPTGASALSMRAAVDVWTAGEEDILLREVTHWSSDDEARAFVEKAIVVGVEDGLDAADAPFEGGVAFVGASKGLWTRTVTWRQGEYGMTVSHFAVDEDSDDVIRQAATFLADTVEDATDQPIVASGADEPPVSTSSSGGIGIFTILLWVVIIGGMALMVVKVRRLRAANAEAKRGRHPDATRDDDSTDVDDIIERARARGRAEREIEAIPDPSRTPPDDI